MEQGINPGNFFQRDLNKRQNRGDTSGSPAKGGKGKSEKGLRGYQFAESMAGGAANAKYAGANVKEGNKRLMTKFIGRHADNLKRLMMDGELYKNLMAGVPLEKREVAEIIDIVNALNNEQESHALYLEGLKGVDFNWSRNFNGEERFEFLSLATVLSDIVNGKKSVEQLNTYFNTYFQVEGVEELVSPEVRKLIAEYQAAAAGKKGDVKAKLADALEQNVLELMSAAGVIPATKLGDIRALHYCFQNWKDYDNPEFDKQLGTLRAHGAIEARNRNAIPVKLQEILENSNVSLITRAYSISRFMRVIQGDKEMLKNLNIVLEILTQMDGRGKRLPAKEIANQMKQFLPGVRIEAVVEKGWVTSTVKLKAIFDIPSYEEIILGVDSAPINDFTKGKLVNRLGLMRAYCKFNAEREVEGEEIGRTDVSMPSDSRRARKGKEIVDRFAPSAPPMIDNSEGELDVPEKYKDNQSFMGWIRDGVNAYLTPEEKKKKVEKGTSTPYGSVYEKGETVPTRTTATSGYGSIDDSAPPATKAEAIEGWYKGCAAEQVNKVKNAENQALTRLSYEKLKTFALELCKPGAKEKDIQKAWHDVMAWILNAKEYDKHKRLFIIKRLQDETIHELENIIGGENAVKFRNFINRFIEFEKVITRIEQEKMHYRGQLKDGIANAFLAIRYECLNGELHVLSKLKELMGKGVKLENGLIGEMEGLIDVIVDQEVTGVLKITTLDSSNKAYATLLKNYLKGYFNNRDTKNDHKDHIKLIIKELYSDPAKVQQRVDALMMITKLLGTDEQLKNSDLKGYIENLWAEGTIYLEIKKQEVKAVGNTKAVVEEFIKDIPELGLLSAVDYLKGKKDNLSEGELVEIHRVLRELAKALERLEVNQLYPATSGYAEKFVEVFDGIGEKLKTMGKVDVKGPDKEHVSFDKINANWQNWVNKMMGKLDRLNDAAAKSKYGEFIKGLMLYGMAVSSGVKLEEGWAKGCCVNLNDLSRPADVKIFLEALEDEEFLNALGRNPSAKKEVEKVICMTVFYFHLLAKTGTLVQGKPSIMMQLAFFIQRAYHGRDIATANNDLMLWMDDNDNAAYLGEMQRILVEAYNEKDFTERLEKYLSGGSESWKELGEVLSSVGQKIRTKKDNGGGVVAVGRGAKAEEKKAEKNFNLLEWSKEIKLRGTQKFGPLNPNLSILKNSYNQFINKLGGLLGAVIAKQDVTDGNLINICGFDNFIDLEASDRRVFLATLEDEEFQAILNKNNPELRKKVGEIIVAFNICDYILAQSVGLRNSNDPLYTEVIAMFVADVILTGNLEKGKQRIADYIKQGCNVDRLDDLKKFYYNTIFNKAVIHTRRFATDINTNSINVGLLGAIEQMIVDERNANSYLIGLLAHHSIQDCKNVFKIKGVKEVCRLIILLSRPSAELNDERINDIQNLFVEIEKDILTGTAEELVKKEEVYSVLFAEAKNIARTFEGTHKGFHDELNVRLNDISSKLSSRKDGGVSVGGGVKEVKKKEVPVNWDDWVRDMKLLVLESSKNPTWDKLLLNQCMEWVLTLGRVGKAILEGENIADAGLAQACLFNISNIKLSENRKVFISVLKKFQEALATNADAYNKVGEIIIACNICDNLMEKSSFFKINNVNNEFYIISGFLMEIQKAWYDNTAKKRIADLIADGENFQELEWLAGILKGVLSDKKIFEGIDKSAGQEFLAFSERMAEETRQKNTIYIGILSGLGINNDGIKVPGVKKACAAISVMSSDIIDAGVKLNNAIGAFKEIEASIKIGQVDDDLVKKKSVYPILCDSILKEVAKLNLTDAEVDPLKEITKSILQKLGVGGDVGGGVKEVKKKEVPVNWSEWANEKIESRADFWKTRKNGEKKAQTYSAFVNKLAKIEKQWLTNPNTRWDKWFFVENIISLDLSEDLEEAEAFVSVLQDIEIQNLLKEYPAVEKKRQDAIILWKIFSKIWHYSCLCGINQLDKESVFNLYFTIVKCLIEGSQDEICVTAEIMEETIGDVLRPKVLEKPHESYTRDEVDKLYELLNKLLSDNEFEQAVNQHRPDKSLLAQIEEWKHVTGIQKRIYELGFDNSAFQVIEVKQACEAIEVMHDATIVVKDKVNNTIKVFDSIEKTLGTAEADKQFDAKKMIYPALCHKAWDVAMTFKLGLDNPLIKQLAAIFGRIRKKLGLNPDGNQPKGGKGPQNDGGDKGGQGGVGDAAPRDGGGVDRNVGGGEKKAQDGGAVNEMKGGTGGVVGLKEPSDVMGNITAADTAEKKLEVVGEIIATLESIKANKGAKNEVAVYEKFFNAVLSKLNAWDASWNVSKGMVNEKIEEIKRQWGKEGTGEGEVRQEIKNSPAQKAGESVLDDKKRIEEELQLCVAYERERLKVNEKSFAVGFAKKLISNVVAPTLLGKKDESQFEQAIIQEIDTFVNNFSKGLPNISFLEYMNTLSFLAEVLRKIQSIVKSNKGINGEDLSWLMDCKIGRDKFIVITNAQERRIGRLMQEHRGKVDRVKGDVFGKLKAYTDKYNGITDENFKKIVEYIGYSVSYFLSGTIQEGVKLESLSKFVKNLEQSTEFDAVCNALMNGELKNILNDQSAKSHELNEVNALFEQAIVPSLNAIKKTRDNRIVTPLPVTPSVSTNVSKSDTIRDDASIEETGGVSDETKAYLKGMRQAMEGVLSVEEEKRVKAWDQIGTLTNDYIQGGDEQKRNEARVAFVVLGKRAISKFLCKLQEEVSKWEDEVEKQSVSRMIKSINDKLENSRIMTDSPEVNNLLNHLGMVAKTKDVGVIKHYLNQAVWVLPNEVPEKLLKTNTFGGDSREAKFLAAVARMDTILQSLTDNEESDSVESSDSESFYSASESSENSEGEDNFETASEKEDEVDVKEWSNESEADADDQISEAEEERSGGDEISDVKRSGEDEISGDDNGVEVEAKTDARQKLVKEQLKKLIEKFENLKRIEGLESLYLNDDDLKNCEILLLDEKNRGILEKLKAMTKGELEEFFKNFSTVLGLVKEDEDELEGVFDGELVDDAMVAVKGLIKDLGENPTETYKTARALVSEINGIRDEVKIKELIAQRGNAIKDFTKDKKIEKEFLRKYTIQLELAKFDEENKLKAIELVTKFIENGCSFERNFKGISNILKNKIDYCVKFNWILIDEAGLEEVLNYINEIPVAEDKVVLQGFSSLLKEIDWYLEESLANLQMMNSQEFKRFANFFDNLLKIQKYSNNEKVLQLIATYKNKAVFRQGTVSLLNNTKNPDRFNDIINGMKKILDSDQAVGGVKVITNQAYVMLLKLINHVETSVNVDDKVKGYCNNLIGVICSFDATAKGFVDGVLLNSSNEVRQVNADVLNSFVKVIKKYPEFIKREDFSERILNLALQRIISNLALQKARTKLPKFKEEGYKKLTEEDYSKLIKEVDGFFKELLTIFQAANNSDAVKSVLKFSELILKNDIEVEMRNVFAEDKATRAEASQMILTLMGEWNGDGRAANEIFTKAGKDAIKVFLGKLEETFKYFGNEEVAASIKSMRAKLDYLDKFDDYDAAEIVADLLSELGKVANSVEGGNIEKVQEDFSQVEAIWGKNIIEGYLSVETEMENVGEFASALINEVTEAGRDATKASLFIKEGKAAVDDVLNRLNKNEALSPEVKKKLNEVKDLMLDARAMNVDQMHQFLRNVESLIVRNEKNFAARTMTEGLFNQTMDYGLGQLKSTLERYRDASVSKKGRNLEQEMEEGAEEMFNENETELFKTPPVTPAKTLSRKDQWMMPVTPGQKTPGTPLNTRDDSATPTTKEIIRRSKAMDHDEYVSDGEIDEEIKKRAAASFPRTPKTLIRGLTAETPKDERKEGKGDDIELGSISELNLSEDGEDSSSSNDGSDVIRNYRSNSDSSTTDTENSLSSEEEEVKAFLELNNPEERKKFYKGMRLEMGAIFKSKEKERKKALREVALMIKSCNEGMAEKKAYAAFVVLGKNAIKKFLSATEGQVDKWSDDAAHRKNPCLDIIDDILLTIEKRDLFVDAGVIAGLIEILGEACANVGEKSLEKLFVSLNEAKEKVNECPRIERNSDGTVINNDDEGIDAETVAQLEEAEREINEIVVEQQGSSQTNLIIFSDDEMDDMGSPLAQGTPVESEEEMEDVEGAAIQEGLGDLGKVSSESGEDEQMEAMEEVVKEEKLEKGIKTPAKMGPPVKSNPRTPQVDGIYAKGRPNDFSGAMEATDENWTQPSNVTRDVFDELITTEYVSPTVEFGGNIAKRLTEKQYNKIGSAEIKVGKQGPAKQNNLPIVINQKVLDFKRKYIGEDGHFSPEKVTDEAIEDLNVQVIKTLKEMTKPGNPYANGSGKISANEFIHKVMTNGELENWLDLLYVIYNQKSRDTAREMVKEALQLLVNAAVQPAKDAKGAFNYYMVLKLQEEFNEETNMISSGTKNYDNIDQDTLEKITRLSLVWYSYFTTEMKGNGFSDKIKVYEDFISKFNFLKANNRAQTYLSKLYSQNQRMKEIIDAMSVDKLIVIKNDDGKAKVVTPQQHNVGGMKKKKK